LLHSFKYLISANGVTNCCWNWCNKLLLQMVVYESIESRLCIVKLRINCIYLCHFIVQAAGLSEERERATSAAVGGSMVVLGGGGNGDDLITFERYDAKSNVWVKKPEWRMAKARHR